MSPTPRPAPLDGDDRTPAVDRGPTRPLSERAARMAARRAMTDRRGRFRERLDAVRADAERRRRRARVRDRLTVAALLVGLPALGWWLAGSVDGVEPGTGAVVGLVAAVLALIGRRQARAYARSRGAQAWDWTTGRHVTHGDPSKRVQETTGGADRRPGSGRGAGPWR